MDIITSLKNDKVKLLYGLQNRKNTRLKEKKIPLEGTRLVLDAIERKHTPLFLMYDPARIDYELLAELQQRDFEIIPVSGEVMAHISDTENPQGIVGVFKMPFPRLPEKPRGVLIFDNVRDPGNVGTMLRSAAASGVDVVVFSPGCVDPYNPKVLRAGMGAHFRVPIAEAQWQEIAGYCEDLDVYLAAGDGDTDYATVDWTRRWAVVIGSEAHGVGESAEILPDANRIKIPMAAGTESINAASAAAVILFEAARQRRVSIV